MAPRESKIPTTLQQLGFLYTPILTYIETQSLYFIHDFKSLEAHPVSVHFIQYRNGEVKL